MAMEPARCCQAQLADSRAPLQQEELAVIADLPGVYDWRAAAEQHAAPATCAWDVFISHAGCGADKGSARAVYRLLERTGWGLRIFLDDESLQPGSDAQHSIQSALHSTAIAVLPFSTEFFNGSATRAELQLLASRHAGSWVQLLPVFLQMNVVHSLRSMAAILGRVCQHCAPS